MRRKTYGGIGSAYGGSGSAFVKMLRLDSELRVTNFEQRAIFVRRACLAPPEVGKASDTRESGDPDAAAYWRAITLVWHTTWRRAARSSRSARRAAA